MKMAIKETVEIRFSTPKKTGSVTCNPYYDADGNHRAISTPIEGEYRTVRQTTASRVLDLSIPKHREEYEFLKDHPFVIGREPLLKIINTTIESETKINDIDVTFDALKIVKDLQATKLSDFARVCGIPTTNTSETVIKAKLYEIELKKREDANNQNKVDKGEIGWGSQIRSYVLHPYQMVKDLRTNVEVGNTQSVLDGDIDVFIESALALKVGMKR